MPYDHTYHPFIQYQNLDINPMPVIYKNIVLGRYLVYQNGDIYSNYTKKLIKHEINWAGYHRVDLTIYPKGHAHFSVHQLVATAYVVNPYPDIYTDVNHRNGNKDINDYWNLEWCNNNQNKFHASKNGLYEHGEDRYNAVYTEALAHEICSLFQAGVPYKEVYKMYVNKDNGSTMGSFVYKLFHRKTWRHVTDQYTY